MRKLVIRSFQTFENSQALVGQSGTYGMRRKETVIKGELGKFGANSADEYDCPGAEGFPGICQTVQFF